MKNLILSIILGLTYGITNGQVLTQTSVTQGFSTGIDLGYTTWNQEAITEEALGGIGVNLEGAYGFNEHIQGFVNFMYAPSVESGTDLIDSYPVSQLGAGARFIFGGTTGKWRPYLQGALSQHKVSFDDDLGFSNKLSGFFAGFGGGILYYVQPNLAINLNAQIDSGTYDNVTVDGQEIEFEFDANTTRFMIGVKYTFE